MQAFLVRLIITALVEVAKNEDIQRFAADQAARLAKLLKDDLLPELLEALVPLIPKFIDGGMKQLSELIPDNILPTLGEADDIARGVVEKVLAADPDLPGISDVFDLSELLRKFLHRD